MEEELPPPSLPVTTPPSSPGVELPPLPVPEPPEPELEPEPPEPELPSLILAAQLATPASKSPVTIVRMECLICSTLLPAAR